MKDIKKNPQSKIMLNLTIYKVELLHMAKIKKKPYSQEKQMTNIYNKYYRGLMFLTKSLINPIL